MSTSTILLLGVPILATWWWLNSRHEKHVEAMRELAFPTLHDSVDDGFHSHVFMDFGQMLFVDSSGHYWDYRTRVYHLWRRDGPTWEISEEWESRKRERTRIAKDRASGESLESDLAKREAEIADDAWRAVQIATLEVAYQRYLMHYKGDLHLRYAPVAFAVRQDMESAARRAAKA